MWTVKARTTSFTVSSSTFDQALGPLGAGWDAAKAVTEGFQRSALWYACVEKIRDDVRLGRVVRHVLDRYTLPPPDGSSADQRGGALTR